MTDFDDSEYVKARDAAAKRNVEQNIIDAAKCCESCGISSRQDTVRTAVERWSIKSADWARAFTLAAIRDNNVKSEPGIRAESVQAGLEAAEKQAKEFNARQDAWHVENRKLVVALTAAEDKIAWLEKCRNETTVIDNVQFEHYREKLDAAEKEIKRLTVLTRLGTFARRYNQLLKAANEMRAALVAIEENGSELQPNSGHMYLANVNYCYKKAKDALKAFDASQGEK